MVSQAQKNYNTLSAAGNARAAMMARGENNAGNGLEFMTGRRRRKQRNTLVIVFVTFMSLVFLLTLYGPPPFTHPPTKSNGRALPNLEFTPPPNWTDLKYLFVFGDSYTSTGFKVDGQLPSLDNPLGNPAYPGDTSSGYANWVDYLTLEYNQSAVLTYDFAVGGATINNKLSDDVPKSQWLNTIRTQIERVFLPAAESEVIPKGGKKSEGDTSPDGIGGWTPENSLFIIWIGINDIHRSFTLRNGKQMEKFHDSILSVYMGLVGKLHKAGARHFVFINVPPVERSPGTVAKGPEFVDAERTHLKSFNTRLARIIPKNTMLFDSEVIFNDMMDNPENYGLKDAQNYCLAYAGRRLPSEDYEHESCGGIKFKEFFWVDGLHPTDTAHREVAKRLSQQLGASSDA